MKFDAADIATKLRKIEKSDTIGFRQKEMAEVVRQRLEEVENRYRAAINEALADLEDAGVRL